MSLAIAPGTRVAVYMNLRTKLWSVCAVAGTRGRGKLIGHAADVTLTDCTFVVSEAQRQWTIRKAQRQVHAWIIGTWAGSGGGKKTQPSLPYARVTYNPYRAAHFHIAGNVDAKVETAARVHFASDRFAYFTHED